MFGWVKRLFGRRNVHLHSTADKEALRAWIKEASKSVTVEIVSSGVATKWFGTEVKIPARMLPLDTDAILMAHWEDLNQYADWNLRSASEQFAAVVMDALQNG